PSSRTSCTRAVPDSTMPSVRAAALDTSIIRPHTKGPRSVTRTTTERPLARLVTRTRAPSGNDGCAAVIARASKRSPLAVGLPWKASPYQEATPTAAGGRRGGGDSALAGLTPATRKPSMLTTMSRRTRSSSPGGRPDRPAARLRVRLRLRRVGLPRPLGGVRALREESARCAPEGQRTITGGVPAGLRRLLHRPLHLVRDRLR